MYQLLSMFSFRYFLTVFQISERFINAVLSYCILKFPSRFYCFLMVYLHNKSRFLVKRALKCSYLRYFLQKLRFSTLPPTKSADFWQKKPLCIITSISHNLNMRFCFEMKNLEKKENVPSLELKICLDKYLYLRQEYLRTQKICSSLGG